MQDPSERDPPPTVEPSYVLRFISGKYQGGEFPVAGDRDIIVGRSSDLDMVLVEDMVSRQHARLGLQPDGLWIEDLGSTNGTFVNGEKIKRARLQAGDRLLIGTSILKVMVGDGAHLESITSNARGALEHVAAQRRTNQTRTMSGAIEEVPLPDLLQLFGTSKKNGVLVVRTEDDVGRIFMRRGNIYFAQINDVEDLASMKCLFRMLTWQKGLFDLDAPDDRSFANEIDVTVQEVLMEGLRQLDEFEQLRPALPPLDARLSVAAPLTAPLRDLSHDELDIVQLVMNYGHFTAVLNKSATSDLETAQTIIKLLRGSYILAD